MREIDGARASPPAWYPPLATKSKRPQKAKPRSAAWLFCRLYGTAFLFLGRFPPFFGGDAPLLVAIALVSALVVFAGNALADVLYGVIDPRVRGWEARSRGQCR